MKFVNYFQHQIAYEKTGQGMPLVFLHGFGEDRSMWSAFVKRFPQYQVLTIDFPGCGDSHTMPASIFRMAKIVNAVLVQEAIDRCILVGHSMGGYVTLAFAQLYPSTLKGYCLFHSQAHRDSADKKAGRNKAIEFVQNHGANAFFKGLIPKLFNQDFIKKEKATIEQLIAAASQMSDEAIIHQLLAMRDRPDSQSVLKEAAVPVCFIIGEEDVAVPKENSLNQTHLPKLADIHILPKVGHMGQFEAPEKTATILQNFIELVESGI